MSKIKLDEVEQIIEAGIQDALDGNLTDAHRVRLLRLALALAANEFHRIEKTTSGSVSPEVLMFLQQMSVLTDEDLDPNALVARKAEEAGIEVPEPEPESKIIMP